jgi:hypothetical protein
MLGKNDASNGLQVVYYRDQKAGQKSITCGASSEKLPPVPKRRVSWWQSS